MKPKAFFTQKVTFRMPDEVYDRVMDACRKLNIDRSDFLRLAVDRCLDALTVADFEELRQKE